MPVSINNQMPVNNPAAVHRIPVPPLPAETKTDTEDRSALLYGSLAAIAAAGIVTGGILLAKGKFNTLDSALKKHKLIMEKGTGVLKNNKGEAFTGVLKYRVNENSYLRKYENGRMTLSGKNIDKDGIPLSDKLDYYAINYTIENGRVKNVSSVKRVKDNTISNTKDILTRPEKVARLNTEKEVLKKEVELVNAQINDFIEKRDPLFNKLQQIKAKQDDFISSVPEPEKIDQLSPEAQKQIDELVTEYNAVAKEVIDLMKAYDECSAKLGRLQQQIAAKDAEIKRWS